MEENTNYGLIAYDNEEDLQRQLYDMLQINKNQQDQIYALSESVETSVNHITQEIENADGFYYENKDGCQLLSAFSTPTKTFPRVYFYARHFGRIKGTFSITFMGICSGSSVSSTVDFIVDGQVLFTRSLSATKYQTVETTFDLDIPLSRGLHEFSVRSITDGSSQSDNLAVYSYEYNLPHPYIECLSTAKTYYVGQGVNLEMLGVSDGHTARFVYRKLSSSSAYGTDLANELNSATYSGFGDVLTVDVFNHSVTGLKNAPVIVARTPNSNTYYFHSDFAGANDNIGAMEIEHKYNAAACVATLSTTTDGSIENTRTFVYLTNDGTMRMSTNNYDGTMTHIDLPTIKDNVFRIEGTRGIAGANIQTVDFVVETVEGKLIHYNIEGSSPATAPTKIYRQELGYGRHPVLYYSDELQRYILFYRKKGSLYRREFSLDKSRSAYKVYAEKYLCDGDMIYFIDEMDNYAIVYDNKFVKTSVDNPKGY